MWRLGISSKQNDVDEALMRDYAEAGVAAMELSPHWERYDEVDYANIRRLADEYGVELWSYHLQFYPGVDLSSPSDEVRKYSIARLAGQIKSATDIGIERLVIHPSKEPIADGERGEYMKRSKEGLCVLADEAERCGATLCVEDLPRTCLGHNSAEMLELLSADERLRACFDTNHIVGEAGEDYVRAIGKRIVTLHVSDYDFVDERHWLPGWGKVDWDALTGALREVGYDGVWMYEVDFRPTAKVADGELTCAQIAANAKRLGVV